MPSGSSSSACQTSFASAPRAPSAQAASWSSFDPGKTTTATIGRGSLTRRRSRSRSSRSAGSRAAARTSARPRRARSRRRPRRPRGRRPGRRGASPTAKPRCRSDSCTASPCGSRMPCFGRTRTVAFTGAPRSGRRGSRRSAIAGQALERLDVACPRAGDDVLGQLRPGRGLVPAERLAVVADELLVERRLGAAGLVLVGRPEAGRVGRERLVGEDEVPVARRARTRTSCRRSGSRARPRARRRSGRASSAVRSTSR